MTATGPSTGVGGVEINAPVSSAYEQILTEDALVFLADLHREFQPERSRLLAARQERQKEIDAGAKPDFLESTRSIRDADWKVSAPPKDLMDRRVEITGPVDRKMVINALNADVKVFMADFEDATAPTWDNLLSGQINLKDAVRRTIDFVSPEGKQYRLSENPAVLMVRPRGWHLLEKHVRVDGQPMSGSLFDFGLFFFHNAKALLERGTGPYFYRPKLESHLEARLWNDLFCFAQDRLGVARGSIKATVLIETILAAFEMDKILYELCEHSAGLNCGRWDYIFSCIKKFGRDKDFCLADRSLVTMNTNFMRSYSRLTIRTCHRRGAHAMGGMAAQIPIKNDPAANAKALAKVLADKEREAGDGHDGTWVAHPGLAPIALQAFNKAMPGANQVDRPLDDISFTTADLLDFGPEAPITEAGLRINCNVGLRYVGARLGGMGCVPIFNLMEDAATAEICRSQIWQWINSPKGVLDDGRNIDITLFRQVLDQELEKVSGSDGKGVDRTLYERAAKIIDQLATGKKFADFLTLSAYEQLP